MAFFEFVIAAAVPVVTAGMFIEEVLFPLSGLAPTDFINIIIICIFEGGKECILISTAKNWVKTWAYHVPANNDHNKNGNKLAKSRAVNICTANL